MRWPGTIQPSRFLSHTGQVLPGVRRVVQVTNPAAGADWTVTVPAGVMWEVRAGVATLTTSATVDTRVPTMGVTVDDTLVWSVPWPSGQAAGKVVTFPVGTGMANGAVYANGSSPALLLPDDLLPQGAVIATSTALLQVGDQWSGISLWVEEVYVTDPQLSEDARLHAELERDIAVYEYEQAQQAGGNA